MNSTRNPGSTRRSRHTAIVLSTAAAATALGGAVTADVTRAVWTNSNNFDYRVIHMPDLDQRRTALPSNGSMYCVPTAAINLMAYASNHGFNIAPGPGNWQSQSKYNQASSAISLMGGFMGTSASGGTGGSGAHNGYSFWILQNGLLSYNGYKKSSSYTPTVPKMAKLGCQGWIVSFAYGRYEVIGSIGSIPRVDRTGGHAVTLAGAFATPTFRLLRYRDPSSDSASLTTQSDFADRLTNFEPVTVAFSTIDIRTMSAIDYPSDDGLIRIVDSYRAIRPKFGISFFPGSDAIVGSGSLQLIDPTPFEGSVNLQLPTIGLSPFVTLWDTAMHPDQTELLIIQKSLFGGASQLRVMDLFEGTSMLLPAAPGDLERIATGRKNFIYGFDVDGKLYRLSAADGSVLNAISTNPDPSAIAPDEDNDALWLLSVSTRRLMRYPETLVGAAGPLNWVIPTSVPMSGDGSVAIDPTNGKPYFCTAASDSIYGVSQGAAGGLDIEVISLPAIQNPEWIRFGPSGEMMVLGDGSVKVLRKSVVGGGWQLDPSDPFHMMPASTPMVISGNFDNHDPSEHETPGWSDIPVAQLVELGVEVPDCTGDLNSDGIVDGNDLTIVLGAWGGNGTLADINFDGVIDGSDLAIVLGGWGPCPQ